MSVLVCVFACARARVCVHACASARARACACMCVLKSCVPSMRIDSDIEDTDIDTAVPIGIDTNTNTNSITNRDLDADITTGVAIGTTLARAMDHQISRFFLLSIFFFRASKLGLSSCSSVSFWLSFLSFIFFLNFFFPPSVPSSLSSLPFPPSLYHIHTLSHTLACSLTQSVSNSLIYFNFFFY